MYKKKISLALICFCPFFLNAIRLHAQYDDRPRLIGFQKARFTAMINKDTLALTRLLADDLVYTYASGVVDGKHSLLKDIALGDISFQYIIPEKITAVIDGNYAWIFGRANIRFKLSKMTGSIDQYVSFIDVYRQKYNQWQLIICHNARIQKDAPYSNHTPQAYGSPQPSIY
jgi:Domain of unknown function (DUF4440)